MLLKTEDGHGLETVMTLLLVRFGIIVALVAIVVIILFAIILVLRRRGQLDQATRVAAPVLRSLAGRYLDQRYIDRRSGSQTRSDGSTSRTVRDDRR